MLLSLILCTIHRTKEVEVFLNTLRQQTYKNFEVIMIDQNDDYRLIPIVKKYQKDFSIQYVRSEKGLSKARNVGLKYASGDIVAFPDDDCTYPSELLQSIYNFFLTENYSIMMGKTIDKKSRKIVAGKAVYDKEVLSCYRFLGSSTTMFLNLKKIDKSEVTFDERFGLGARFGGGEEEDLMIRLLNKGYKGLYNPDVNYVYHPPSDLNFSDLNRAKERAVGLGGLVAKHLSTLCGLFYFLKYVLIHPFVSIVKTVIRFDITMVKYHFFKFSGIMIGLVSFIMLRKSL